MPGYSYLDNEFPVAVTSFAVLRVLASEYLLNQRLKTPTTAVLTKKSCICEVPQGAK